jgi:iron complex outermembrane receptor protein
LTAASASGATTGGISAVSLHGLTSIRTLVLLNGRRIAPYGIGFTGDFGLGRRQQHSARGDRARRGAQGRRVGDLRLGRDRRRHQLHPAPGIQGRRADRRIRRHDAWRRQSEARPRAPSASAISRAIRFNVMVVGSYQKEGALFGRDRGFAGKAYNVATTNDTTSGNTFPGNIVPADGSGGTTNPSAPDCPGPLLLQDPLFPPDRCRYDPSPSVTLIPASERFSVFASGKYAITPDILAFVEASLQQEQDPHRHPAGAALGPVQHPAAERTLQPGAVQQHRRQRLRLDLPADASSIYYPTAFATAAYGGTPDLLVRYRSALTGDRDITDISEAPRAVAGVKGIAMGWDFDVAGLYSQSKVREKVSNGFPLLTQLMPLLNSGNVNPFGPSDPAVEAQVAATNFTGDAYSIKSSLTSLAGKASREVMQLQAGPLGLAFGGEVRKEKFDFSASAALQAGDVSGYGGNFLPTSQSRNVGAVFGEVNIPIVKNLEANIAARYDHYEGVGNSTTPKGSLRWQPVPQVLLRTSYGRGFRRAEPAGPVPAAADQRHARRPERPRSMPGDEQRQRLPDPVQRAVRR